MIDLEQQRKEAEELKNKGNYKEAGGIYVAIINESDGFELWDTYSLAFCLSKSGDFKRSIECGEKIKKEVPDFEKINISLAWDYYKLYLKNYSANIDYGEFTENKKVLKRIVELTEKEDLPRKISALKMLDAAEVFNDNDYILSMRNILDKESLDKKPFGERGLSQLEKFYTRLSKAALNLKKYELIIEICNEAVSQLKGFSNITWFLHRKSKALAGMNQLSEAIDIINEILNNKDEWFFRRELSEYLYKTGDLEGSFSHAVKACFNSVRMPEKEKMWKLYYQTGAILRKMDDTDAAWKHIAYAAKLRESSNWEIKEDLRNVLHEMEIKLDEINMTDIRKELESFWEEKVFEGSERKSGVIKKIHENGKIGFINSENKDYYFKLKDFRGRRKNINEGINVEFNIVESFDGKKNKKSEAAVNIKQKNW